MRINIIIEDSKVEQAREEFGNDRILRIPLSPTGENPATHWFCSMAGDEDKMNTILGRKKFSEMELNTSPKEFLQKWNLKVIR